MNRLDGRVALSPARRAVHPLDGPVMLARVTVSIS